MLKPGKRVTRSRRGDYALSLPEQERELLRSLPGQLIDRLEAGPDEPDLVRLFPPAYPRDEDQKAEQEYRGLMGADLLDRHKEALKVMAATMDAERLDEEQMAAWLRSLNELRLVLGTRLDVSEDQIPPPPGDPRASGFALYSYLSWLQGQVIDAMSGAL
ncbi:MAG: DUF2017 family protein [Acidimicrobiales bacterium]